jgi:hypothetical protein
MPALHHSFRVGGRVVDCSEDIACQLFDWFSSNGFVLRETFVRLDALWNAAGGQITHFLSEHGEKIVAALSFSFGVWRWWIYRERVLHKRLEEYIRESDARLGPTTSRMMDAILRPGRGLAVAQPAFALELNDVLETHDWRSFFGISPVGRQAERQLRRAIVGIRKRERTVADAARSLQRQRAEAHMLKGAIEVSKARRMSDQRKAGQYDGAALREFQRTLQIETHRRDAEAKECEAFQFLRLGQRDHAEAAYKQVEDFAADLVDTRQRDLMVARAKRYRAQIMQAKATRGAMGALMLIGGANSNNWSTTSLGLRARYAPYLSWDAIEQAEAHYVTAWIAFRLDAGVREATQLDLSEALYKEILVKLPKRLFWLRRGTRILRAEAAAGLDRAKLARSVRKYDEKWLVPQP